MINVLCRFIPLDFLVFIFIMLGSKFGGNLAVESGKVGFELLQFFLFAPRLRDDGFELGNIGFEVGSPFLILGDNTGDFLQSVYEVHAGGMGVAHGDVIGLPLVKLAEQEPVVELVFVVAFNNKTVLNCLLTVNKCALRYDGNREAIDFADAFVLTVCVGTLRQCLQMDTHVLLIGEVASVDGEIVLGIAVFISHYYCLIADNIRLHPLDCRLVVGNVMGDDT